MTVSTDTVYASTTLLTSQALTSAVGVEPQPVAVPPDAITEGRTVPFMIERDQAYYWTQRWQDAINGTVADLQAGEFVRFDSDDPTDVARWL